MIRHMKTELENKRIYLDWAAATPLASDVFDAMEPFLRTEFGNPSAIHAEGQFARNAVELARVQVASAVQVRPEFVSFTSGGTEANNLAIVGSVESLRQQGRLYSDMSIITTGIEHPSVSNALARLASLGVEILHVDVNEYGIVDLQNLKSLLSEKTVLVSLAYANSEIGVIQPLHAIKKCIKEAEKQNNSTIIFHVDAAQAPLWLNCQFDSVGADLLALDMLKCCGPKGTGVLVQSRRAQLIAISGGGGQEKGLRPGTENVPGIVGAGIALTLAQATWRERSEQVVVVRNKGIEYLLKKIPNAVINGPKEEHRIANNINISIPGLDTEFAAVVLDSKGFAVSTKSACAGSGGGESTVVLAISKDTARAESTLRFSIGPDTTIAELQELTDVLAEHVLKMNGLTQV
jgi:cysteine desulfurase